LSTALPSGTHPPSTTVALSDARPPQDVACHGGVGVSVVLTLRSPWTPSMTVRSRRTAVTMFVDIEDTVAVAYMSLRRTAGDKTGIPFEILRTQSEEIKVKLLPDCSVLNLNKDKIL